MIFLSNLDVTDSNSFEAVVKNVQDIAGDDGLNLLINNAACNNFQNYDDVTEDGMMEIFRSNTVAPLMLSKVSYFTGTQLVNVDTPNDTTKNHCVWPFVLHLLSVCDSLLNSEKHKSLYFFKFGRVMKSLLGP